MEKYKKELGKTRRIIYRKKCRVMEENNKKGRTRELHQQIREITGKSKINTGMIRT
jgi:hypothetical protein